MVESEYGKAIYDLAVEENKVEFYEECLNTVEATLTKDFVEILTSPFINNDNKKKMITKVYHSLDESFLNFLYVLIDHNRFGIFHEIKVSYEAFVREAKNIMRVELLSAEALNEKQILKFKKTLEGQYPGKNVQITNTVKPDLIGGVQFIMDERSLDASIKGTLDKIRESI